MSECASERRRERGKRGRQQGSSTNQRLTDAVRQQSQTVRLTGFPHRISPDVIRSLSPSDVLLRSSSFFDFPSGSLLPSDQRVPSFRLLPLSVSRSLLDGCFPFACWAALLSSLSRLSPEARSGLKRRTRAPVKEAMCSFRHTHARRIEVEWEASKSGGRRSSNNRRESRARRMCVCEGGGK